MNNRRQIAERQEALLRSLILSEPVPEGFDEERLELCGRTLQNKRLRTILRLHPWMRDLLGDKLQAHWQDYARSVPVLPNGGACADGLGFRHFLRTNVPELRQCTMKTTWWDLRALPSRILAGFRKHGS